MGYKTRYDDEFSELEPEFIGKRYDAAAVTGLAFMGVLPGDPKKVLLSDQA